MLTGRGAKLLDFGLARLHAYDTYHNPTVHTGEGASLQNKRTLLARAIELAKSLRYDSQSAPNIETTKTQVFTSQGVILGTIQYMAPEQLQGLPLDARTDIFALGLVLYEMVTGRRPYDGTDGPELLVEMRSSSPL